ncbi:MAG: hypothetical protein COA79_04375 [Planctomycetota bacterium]|nr:MAG: hypothetical protein COA79_04375 [Planctomycetota bacterium]
MNTEENTFKAIADPSRRKILNFLLAGEKTTGDLCELLPQLNRCTVMLHLNVLAGSNLIKIRRQGRNRWNSLNLKAFNEMIYWIKKFQRLIEQQEIKESETLSEMKNKTFISQGQSLKQFAHKNFDKHLRSN